MRTLCLCLLACAFSLSSAAQTSKLIRLSKPKARPTASRIRIVSVIDDRDDTANIGTMRAGISNRPRTVSLEHGVAASIKDFYSLYENSVADAVPVTVHLRSLEISEKVVGMKERLNIRYNYAFVGEAGELSYDGSAFAESNMDVSQYIERLVRESLIATFDKVADAWKTPEAAAQQQQIAISAKIEPQPAGTGLISFDRDRPLTYEDYKGEPDDLSRGSAATYTGISFAYSAQQNGPDFRIIVTLSAITDPRKSWMRAIGRNPKVMAHENLHFAITALMACRLADTLRGLVVTKADYDTKLRTAFNAIDRQQEQQQRQYDQESYHGTKPLEQKAWEEKIYAELKRSACYGY
jgi:hypothetical protein